MALSLQRFSTGVTSGGRALVAFLVAPLVSSFIVTCLAIFVFLWQMPPGDNPPPADGLKMAAAYVGIVIWMWIVMGAPWSLMGMALVGLPAYAFLRFFRGESGAAYALIGALGGYCIAPEFGGHKWAGFPLGLTGAAGGALAMLLFWRMARRPASWPA